MRRSLFLTITLLALALPATAAQGADYYVAPNGSDAMNSCTVAATPCATITRARDVITSVQMPGNVVHVAARDGANQAVYDGGVDFGNNAAWVGATVIDGSYLATAPGQRAKITNSTAGPGLSIGSDDGGVKHLEIVQSAGSGYALAASGKGMVVEDVVASTTNNGNTFGVVRTDSSTANQASPVTIRDSSFSSNAVGAVLVAASNTNLTTTVEDSSFESLTASQPTLNVSSNLVLRRVDISNAGSDANEAAIRVNTDAISGSPALTIEDTLIYAGGRGIALEPTNPASNATLTLRSSTVDAVGPSLYLNATSGGVATATVANSILTTAPSPGMGGSAGCTYTDVPGTTTGCASGDGTGNQTSTPEDLFVNRFTDWRLKPTAAVVDKGSALGNDESSTDLDGAPRVVAVNTCPAVRDLGAYELQSPVKDCAPVEPSPTATASPTAQPTGQPTVAPTASPTPQPLGPLTLSGLKVNVKKRLVTFTQSRPAVSKLTYTGKVSGRKKGKKCVVGRKKGKKCSKKLKKLTETNEPNVDDTSAGPAVQSVLLPRLKKGSYTVSVSATAADGAKAKAIKKTFRVK